MIPNSLTFWTAENANSFAEFRGDTSVYVKVPTETECTACGWDPQSQSAVNMQCTVCNGTGKITSWTTYQIMCRLMWTAMMKFAYQFPSSGVEMGDCIITVGQEWKALLDLVLESERSYIIADKKTVRPITQQNQTVPGILKEYEYVCNLFSPNS
jgi:hypothetical protein